jgi:L-2-hydroxyglutarate oxidase LhgO
MMQEMEQIDTTVIGAGVVGLAAALAIARRGTASACSNGEPRPGMGTSTHNSQVIHAGIYYPPGTLKARHCVGGARMLYDFCSTYAVPHRRCGKLIVARDDSEVDALHTLKARGEGNGVEGLELVDARFIQAARAARARGAPRSTRRIQESLDAEALVRTLARLCADHEVAVLPGRRSCRLNRRAAASSFARPPNGF